MDKNTITGLVLIGVVLMGFSFWSSSKQQEAAQQVPQTEQVDQKKTDATEQQTSAATADTVDSNSITPYWTSNTSDNSNEIQGGGDILYTTDTNLVTNAIGTLVANKVGTTTAYGYWLASRVFVYDSSLYWRYSGRGIKFNGDLYDSGLHFYYFDGGIHVGLSCQTLRPIVTLKFGIPTLGSGTSVDPWVLQ